MLRRAALAYGVDREVADGGALQSPVALRLELAHVERVALGAAARRDALALRRDARRRRRRALLSPLLFLRRRGRNACARACARARSRRRPPRLAGEALLRRPLCDLGVRPVLHRALREPCGEGVEILQKRRRGRRVGFVVCAACAAGVDRRRDDFAFVVAKALDGGRSRVEGGSQKRMIPRRAHRLARQRAQQRAQLHRDQRATLHDLATEDLMLRRECYAHGRHGAEHRWHHRADAPLCAFKLHDPLPPRALSQRRRHTAALGRLRPLARRHGRGAHCHRVRLVPGAELDRAVALARERPCRAASPPTRHRNAHTVRPRAAQGKQRGAHFSRKF